MSAEAQVNAREATLRKVVNGARQQERAEALSTVHATEAVMNNSNARLAVRFFAPGHEVGPECPGYIN
jgi:HlyD family secretion protein